ncbi:MAG: hypothetical protein LUH07_00625 [Lachnospiraceae bacterium]|nr:hypothetical protein [Lachnospiraceae bacterium]
MGMDERSKTENNQAQLEASFGMALVDAFSVICFSISIALIASMYHSAVFLIGALLCITGGEFSGMIQATASARSPVLYQACGVASQLIYGIADSVIVFFMDKYLIMKKTE